MKKLRNKPNKHKVNSMKIYSKRKRISLIYKPKLLILMKPSMKKYTNHISPPIDRRHSRKESSRSLRERSPMKI